MDLYLFKNNSKKNQVFMIAKRPSKHLVYLVFFIASELAGTRTQDPYIKSVLLYQLSYQFISFFIGVQK